MNEEIQKTMIELINYVTEAAVKKTEDKMRDIAKELVDEEVDDRLRDFEEDELATKVEEIVQRELDNGDFEHCITSHLESSSSCADAIVEAVNDNGEFVDSDTAKELAKEILEENLCEVAQEQDFVFHGDLEKMVTDKINQILVPVKSVAQEEVIKARDMEEFVNNDTSGDPSECELEAIKKGAVCGCGEDPVPADRVDICATEIPMRDEIMKRHAEKLPLPENIRVKRAIEGLKALMPVVNDGQTSRGDILDEVSDILNILERR